MNFLNNTLDTGCVRVLLTLRGPLVWLQHQVLFGLFQLLLQTLVLGSDFTDSLLTVLQQTELGADTHHLLTRGQGTDTQTFYLFTFSYLEECVLKHVWPSVRSCLLNVHAATRIHTSSTLSVTADEDFRTLSSFAGAVGG